MYDWRLRREWLHFRSMRPIETRTGSPLIAVNGSLYTLSIPCSSLAYPLLKGCYVFPVFPESVSGPA